MMKIKLISYILFLGFICCLINCRFQSARNSLSNPRISETNYTPQVTPTETFLIDNENSSNLENEKNPISCQVGDMAGVWQVLISDIDVKELVIDKNLGGDCSNYINIAEEVDLNGDETKELFVKGNGNFGAVSSIPIWVIGKFGDKYKILLKEQGETYSIKKSRTNGYNNLYFPSRRSVWTANLSTYKFKKGKYRVSKCLVGFYYKSDESLKLIPCDDKKSIDKFESEFKFDN